jgi:hypothetical protein
VTKPNVEIIGLRELQRSLKRFEDGAADLKRANKSAAEIVADRAIAKVPKRSGTLAKTIKAMGQARGASVKAGTAKVPYAGVIEFGGYPDGYPFLPQGRYLTPAAKESTGDVVRLYERELQRLIARTF